MFQTTMSHQTDLIQNNLNTVAVHTNWTHRTKWVNDQPSVKIELNSNDDTQVILSKSIPFSQLKNMRSSEFPRFKSMEEVNFDSDCSL